MPPAPPREQVARIFQTGLAVPFAVRYWDGSEDRFGEGDPVVRLVFRTPGGLGRTLTGALGLGEAYMDGAVEIEGDTRKMFEVLNAMKPELGFGDVARLVWFKVKLGRGDSVDSARRNVQSHYDLGNAFFQLWLDKGMSYSCAYFAEPSFTLEQAQTAKLEHICRKLQLKPGDRLLDIGCGWGALILHAVEKHGADATGVTLSEEQAAYARAQIERRGLGERARVRLEDYRAVKGEFDKIVSVGMFEHVGKSEMKRYFQTVDALLADGGLTLLHTIGRIGFLPIGEQQWARKHIFPGGYLPEAHEIFHSAHGTQLVPIDLENLKPHYAWTLDAWADRFEASLESVRALGFDERFIRMWRFFLYGSAERFRTGILQLYQVTFMKRLRTLLRTRQYLYNQM